MRCALSTAMLLAVLTGLAAGQETVVETPTVQSLTRQAALLQDDIRRSHNPEARKRLVQRLELVYHQMGPTDANGQRIHCQAMWHDRALEHLGQEMKRLSGREVPLAQAQAGALVRHGRVTVRRMARACLTHGWRIYRGYDKYQVDAFGQYLANNLATLDDLLKRLGNLSAPAAGEEADAKGETALAKARAGLAQMQEAADALAELPSDRPAALLPPLGTFVEGLTAVREAVEGVRGPDPAEAETEAPPPAEAEPAGSPPMTEAEKDRSAAIRETAAGLTGPDWAPVAEHLQRFAAMIETGFTLPSARPKARELLEQTERAAGLAKDLAADTLLDAARRASRRDRLQSVLALMGRPAERATGYAELARLCDEDAFRRRVKAIGVSPEAGRGLVDVYYRVAPTWRKSTSAQVVRNGVAMASACAGIVRTMEQMRDGPPDDMAAGLKKCYDRQKDLFRREVELAGVRAHKAPEDALPLLQAADQRGDDLALIVRADTVVQSIRRYQPRQAGTMYQQVLSAAQELVVNPDHAARTRAHLWSLVRPFEALESFPAPDPALRRTLSRLLGQVYTAAVTKLSRDLGAGIHRAAAGDPTPLRIALRADDLFRLARTRALAEEARLQQVGVANLAAFSMPPEIWTSFRGGLDRRLQAQFTAYVRGARTTLWYTGPRDLEAVYGPVVAAQRQTREARFPGEPDLDFLLRNLARAAVPKPSDPARYAWAAGYHATEAAATTLADFDVVADWHARRLRPFRTYLDRVDLSPPEAQEAAGGT
ncbi:MAG: hypothetical protein R6X20_11085 [Phycisphaerae bacterium]